VASDALQYFSALSFKWQDKKKIKNKKKEKRKRKEKKKKKELPNTKCVF